MTDARETLIRILEERSVRYEIVEHDPTFTAQDDARAARVEPASMVKTLVLHDHDGYRLAAIPASRNLDVKRARAALGASAHLRLAFEEEIAAEFPQFEVGAIPPFGARVAEVLDVRLLYRDRVACAAGDHQHSLLVDPRELVRLAEPRVADICEHADPDTRFHDLPHL